MPRSVPLPTRRRARVLAGLLAAGLAAAGCSGDDAGTALPSGPATSAPTATPTGSSAAPTPTATPRPSAGTTRSPIRWVDGPAPAPRRAVQDATRAYWSMVVRLSEAPDPDDPELTELTVSPQRDTLVTVYTTARQQGLSQRGPIDGTATVGAVRGATATATSCLDQSLTRVYDRSGRPRAGSRGVRTLFTVTLERDGTDWKVSGVSGKDGAC